MDSRTEIAGRPRVLIVDDNAVVRHSLRIEFEAHGGFDVVGEAGTIKEAVELVALIKPDAVVLDVRMPDRDGIEAISLLRGSHPPVRIVVSSLLGPEETDHRARMAGADACVDKLGPEKVVTALVGLLGGPSRSN